MPKVDFPIGCANPASDWPAEDVDDEGEEDEDAEDDEPQEGDLGAVHRAVHVEQPRQPTALHGGSFV